MGHTRKATKDKDSEEDERRRLDGKRTSTASRRRRSAATSFQTFLTSKDRAHTRSASLLAGSVQTPPLNRGDREGGRLVARAFRVGAAIGVAAAPPAERSPYTSSSRHAGLLLPNPPRRRCRPDAAPQQRRAGHPSKRGCSAARIQLGCFHVDVVPVELQAASG